MYIWCSGLVELRIDTYSEHPEKMNVSVVEGRIVRLWYIIQISHLVDGAIRLGVGVVSNFIHIYMYPSLKDNRHLEFQLLLHPQARNIIVSNIF